MAIRFKACPHCQGDLFLIKDEDGLARWCLQCGYRQSLKRGPREGAFLEITLTGRRKYKKTLKWYNHQDMIFERKFKLKERVGA